MDISQPIRTALFVPASRPERIDKALASGADAVIIDLEDAVEAAAKDAARANLAAFIAAHPDTALMVRINDAESRWFADDLACVRALPAGSAIVLAKAQSAAQVAAAAATGHPVIPLIETAQGVLALADIAATPGVNRLTFGALDLGLDLGLTPDSAAAATVLDQVRGQLILHNAAAKLAAPLDTVFSAIPNTTENEQGLTHHATRARDMGFGGMLCIHPAQIAPVHAAFAPSPADIAWAQQVLAAAQTNPAGAFRLDGEMVDAPVIARARRVVARAG